jgi:hypothetical protein
MSIASIIGAIAEQSVMSQLLGFTPSIIGTQSQSMLIDLLEGEAPEYGYEITSDSVECGSEISDHINEKPVSLTLDCVFTDFQFSPKNAIEAGMVSGGFLTTWRDKKDTLYKFKDAKELMFISTPLNFYQNYLIESISPSVTAQSGDCFRCRISLRSVNLVASLIGFIDPTMIPIELQAQSSTASKGTKGKEDKGTPETTESKGSAAHKNAEQSGYGGDK